MDLVEIIRNRVRYEPSSGKIYWIFNNKFHPDLLGKEAGCTTDGRVFVKLKGKRIPRARVAYIYMTGIIPVIVDHINGNTLDDRWANLRSCNSLQNSWNITTKRRVKKTGLPVGVRMFSNGTYQARIAYNKKTYCLGAFDTVDAARTAYQEAKQKMHGQFCRKVSNV